jgi:O-acetyl-ADP-ribose deacetylase (regulator of RNase III)
MDPACELECLRRIELVQGDLVLEDVDAIVNAANSRLAGGGGVDGAIHRAAGPELLAACARLHPDGCPTGSARITPGFRLRARHVIHAVGPVYRDGKSGERELLASAYRSAIELAASQGLATIAFPAISAGAYGYPPHEAAEVALAATARASAAERTIECVRFVLFTERMRSTFESARDRRIAAARGGRASF